MDAKRFASNVMTDITSIRITSVSNFLNTVLLLTNMETVPNAKNTMNLTLKETVFLFLKDLLMITVQFINIWIIKDPPIKNGSRDANKFVKFVMKTTFWTIMENVFWVLICCV